MTSGLLIWPPIRLTVNDEFKLRLSMRPILSIDNIHPAIHKKLGGDQTLVNEVQAAIAEHDVVVVGMTMNPVVKSARKLLAENNIEFCYLEYGSYLSMWRPRLSIKMWTGFKTFPQIFVQGVLIGGFGDVKKLIDKGEFLQALSQS